MRISKGGTPLPPHLPRVRKHERIHHHINTYDDWYRLIDATGKFVGSDNKSADYHLVMGYDNLYNITSKKLTMSQTNLQFAGTLSAGHEFNYNYSNDNPMQLASVETKQYNVDRTNMDPNDNFDPEQELLKNLHTQDYEFDDNGNMVSVSVAKNEEENPEGEQEATEEKDVLKSFLWDEENRLLAVNNNGSVSCYFYDAAGERTVKLTSESEMVHVNGKKVGGNANISKFTAYVSPYFVVSNGGAYTKHIYAANQRIASKLGNEDGFGADPRRVEMAGGKKISDIQKDNIGARFSELGFTYTAPEKEKVEKDSSMDSEAEEKLIFFYHPDHLGSTSYVTDVDGNIAQHIEYIPYGEVFVEERNNSFSTNYLFNAKELDNETGLYYYGARYLDPTGAMWLSVDPMWEKNIDANPYNYCHGNPITMVDPDGMDDKPSKAPESVMGTKEYYKFRNEDYLKRHPDKKPEEAPKYYMNYGYKYCERFSEKTKDQLSPSGKKWLDEVLLNLQEAMEQALVNDPMLEENDDKHYQFAFDSHVDAYWNNKPGHTKITDLNTMDLFTIVLTPEFNDILTDEGKKTSRRYDRTYGAILFNPSFNYLSTIQ